jgi:hypothetical protein
MSALLGHNERANIPWKGKTFSQVTSMILKNQNTGVPRDNRNFLRSQPLKIYRREIATINTTATGNFRCNSRTSTSIDVINRPGGSIVNTNGPAKDAKGLANTLDFNLTNNKTELPGSCAPENCVFTSPDVNARRRVRSAGMIKRQFDISKNNDTYCTNTNQYLTNRNRSFHQNQYNFIRVGNAQIKPGDALSVGNVYSPNGINHCQGFQFTANTTFQYQWIDAKYYTVTIPSGSYSFDNIRDLFLRTMDNNFHYYRSRVTRSHIHLLDMAYNSFYNSIELQVTLGGPDSIFSGIVYSLPVDSTNTTITTWTTPAVNVMPGFKILANTFQNASGFAAGNYPANTIQADGNGNPLSNYTEGQPTLFTSIQKPGLKPLYVPIYYKPSNPQFATQGGVSASAFTSRARYDAITKNANLYYNTMGKEVGNALAYGVPENGYTVKDKIGYPNIRVPKFSKYSQTFQCNFVSPLMTRQVTG